jgi:hypothetical protein
LHVLGVIGGIALLAYALLSARWYLALLWPVVHTVPGLIGHRLVERSEAVGDARITRTDFPLWWFIVGNHRLTIELFLGRLTRTSP